MTASTPSDLQKARKLMEHGDIVGATSIVNVLKSNETGMVALEAALILAELQYIQSDFKPAKAQVEKVANGAAIENARALATRAGCLRARIVFKSGMRGDLSSEIAVAESAINSRRSPPALRAECAWFLGVAGSFDVGLIEDINLVQRAIGNARALLADARKQFSKLYMDYRACEVGLDLAVLEESAGELERALGIIEELLPRAETLRYPYILAQGQQLLAEWYRRTGVLDKALTAGKEALDSWERLGNRDALALTYTELGEIYAERENWEAAFDWYGKSRELFKKLGFRHGVAIAENNMGYSWMMREEYKRARVIFKGVLREFERLGIDEDVIKTQLHIINNEFLAQKRKRAKQLLWRLLESKPLKQYPDQYAYAYRIVTREEWLREDPDFAELFAPPPKRAIKRGILEEIIYLARKKHPQEFGALLHGKQIITSLEHVPETAHGRTSVIFNLYNRMSQRKIYADGVAHSHPSGVARPSKADLSLFGTFPGINIIIGFPYTKESWAAYDRLGNRVKVEIID